VRFSSMITAVDAHACGEPGRVITGGVLDVPGKSMFEKKVWLETNAHHLRRRMLREPRGYPAANCNLILPPTIAEADAGFVIMEQTHRRQNKAVAKMTSAAPDPVSGSPFGCNFPQRRLGAPMRRIQSRRIIQALSECPTIRPRRWTLKHFGRRARNFVVGQQRPAFSYDFCNRSTKNGQCCGA
jgi:Proline racemase